MRLFYSTRVFLERMHMEVWIAISLHLFPLWHDRLFHGFLAQAVEMDCRLSLKTLGIPTSHVNPEGTVTGAFNLCFDQPFTKGRCQLVAGGAIVSYRTDSHSYRHQAKTVLQSCGMLFPHLSAHPVH